MCQSASRVKLILGLSSTSKVEDLWTTRLGTAYANAPVFISRCGAGRHVELIPSVFSIYFRIAHYPPRVEAGRITSCSRTSCSHPLVFLSITAGSPTILECLSHWLTPRMREGDRRVGPGNWSGRKCRVAKLFPNHQGRGSPQKYPGPLMNRVDARVLASDLAANRTLFGTHDCG